VAEALAEVNYKLMLKVLAAFGTWSVYAHLRAGRAILRDRDDYRRDLQPTSLLRTTYGASSLLVRADEVIE